MATHLQDILESHDVVGNVGMRIDQRISDTCLGGQMTDTIDSADLFKKRIETIPIR
ncbi:hypothetical protein ES708_25468 [subsurface metagenome]